MNETNGGGRQIPYDNCTKTFDSENAQKDLMNYTH